MSQLSGDEQSQIENLRALNPSRILTADTTFAFEEPMNTPKAWAQSVFIL
jgi:hypothetical protein